MASIKQYIELIDGVTAPLKRIGRATAELYQRQERLGTIVQRTGRELRNIGTAAMESAPGLSRLGSLGAAAMNRIKAARAGAMGLLRGLENQIKATLGSSVGKFALGNIVGNVVLMGVDYAMTQLDGLIAKADQLSGIQARLTLITGDKGKATALDEAIYQAALRSRGDYATIADSVSKIGLQAQEAFPNPREIVPFVENIQKLFTIGGTGAQEQQNALLQLTQALGSGRLQGDELRSISEAAPLLNQAIANYMGVSIGEIKQLGAEGKITAEIIKNAILSATEDINRDFAKLDMRWQDIWTDIGNRSDRAFKPFYSQLAALANSKSAKVFADSMVAGASITANVLSGVLWLFMAIGDGAYMVGGYIGSWFSAGAQIAMSALEILGELAIGALSGAAAAALTYGSYLLFANAQTIALAANELIAAGATMLLSGGVRTFNGILKIMGLLTNFAAMKTMLLTGAQWLLTNPITVVIGLVGLAVGAFTAWQVHTVGLRNTIASGFRSIAEYVTNAVNYMIEKINVLIGVLNTAAKGINSVFHTDIQMIDEIAYKADPKAWGDTAEKFVQEFSLKSLLPDMGDIDIGEFRYDRLDAIAEGTGETAKNTKGIQDALGIMDEDLKFFRDIAEQEAINRYTTASIQISVENHNNIANDVDAEGMIVHLIDQLYEQIDAGGEAVRE